MCPKLPRDDLTIGLIILRNRNISQNHQEMVTHILYFLLQLLNEDVTTEKFIPIVCPRASDLM